MPNTDLTALVQVPERIRTKALQIVKNERGLWNLFITQHGSTCPGEVRELRWVIDLAIANGPEYLVDLCKQAKQEVAHVC